MGRRMNQVLPALLLAGLMGASPLAAQPQPEPERQRDRERDPQPEMRACWVSRFNWTEKDATTEATQARIRSIMETLKANNFNAVLFQVRGECDTLFPNPYEPWGPQFNWTDPGWDPFAYAVEQAHANGLEFHAYVNTHTLADVVPPPETTPQHPYNLHGPESADSWVIHDPDGKPVASTDSYTWISPGHPDASAWTRRMVMYIVENYDIDGVHFDRIRTPAEEFSHDPRTVARFGGDGNPDGGDWGDFMRDQITQDLRRIYGGIALRKPDVKLTAAPFGICRKEPGGYQGTGTESYFQWYQDSFGWMEKGVVDGIFPMIYWRIGSPHPFDVLLADFLRHSGGRHVYAGISGRNDPIAQIYETRRQGAPGSTIWSYGRGEFTAYLAAPYREPAPVPAMPWKDTPTAAIVAGTITDEQGTPLLDAWVSVRGDNETYLSGADGFYTLLNLEPGAHTITVRKNGVGEMAMTLTVQAGDVRQLDLRIPRTTALFSTPEELIEAAFLLAGTDATLLPRGYIQSTLVARDQDEQVKAAFDKALAGGTRESLMSLIRALELKFVHDPALSALDLLGPELSEHFRQFPWDENDFPGSTEGPNEKLCDIMVDALDVIRPERRANSQDVSVIVKSEATDEIFDYMEKEWSTVPGQEEWKLNRHACESFVRMREQARKEGVELIIKSGHREREKAERNAARANNPSAVASFSAHTLGLAIDFQMSQEGREYPEVRTRPMIEVVQMRESPVHKWLFLRAAEFGWYPYQNEPWHWEYNPPGFREVFWRNYPAGPPARPIVVETPVPTPMP